MPATQAYKTTYAYYPEIDVPRSDGVVIREHINDSISLFHTCVVGKNMDAASNVSVCEKMLNTLRLPHLQECVPSPGIVPSVISLSLVP
jgi:hypothetical protein